MRQQVLCSKVSSVVNQPHDFCMLYVNVSSQFPCSFQHHAVAGDVMRTQLAVDELDWGVTSDELIRKHGYLLTSHT